MSKKTQTDIQRINQALSAAISSINLAKNLLKDIEGPGNNPRIDTREIEGIVGVFNGKNLVTAEGKEIEVPVNYASKSKIVFGDTLKMIEGEDRNLFKQIERVKRLTKVGILSEQGGQMVVVTGDGTYNILQVAVDFYNLQEGGQVQIIVPEDNIHAPFATIDKNLEEGSGESKIVQKKVEIIQEVEVKKVEKVEKKKIEPVIEMKEVAKPKQYTSKKIISAVKKETPKPVVRKPEVKSIANDKPKTSNIIQEDNSISRIVGDDDLR